MNCIGCGAPILKARLEAVPWTQYCTLCATEIELRKQQVMTRATEYMNEAFKLAEDMTGASEMREITPEQAADERADNLLCRQIERIEGFEES